MEIIPTTSLHLRVTWLPCSRCEDKQLRFVACFYHYMFRTCLSTCLMAQLVADPSFSQAPRESEVLAFLSEWTRRRPRSSGTNWRRRQQRSTEHENWYTHRIGTLIAKKHGNSMRRRDFRLWIGLQGHAPWCRRTILHGRRQRHGALRGLPNWAVANNSGLRGFFIRYFFYVASDRSFEWICSFLTNWIPFAIGFEQKTSVGRHSEVMLDVDTEDPAVMKDLVAMMRGDSPTLGAWPLHVWGVWTTTCSTTVWTKYEICHLSNE